MWGLWANSGPPDVSSKKKKEKRKKASLFMLFHFYEVKIYDPL